MLRKEWGDYERLGTDELERLLRINAAMPEGGGLSNGELLYICQILAERRAAEESVKADPL